MHKHMPEYTHVCNTCTRGVITCHYVVIEHSSPHHHITLPINFTGCGAQGAADGHLHGLGAAGQQGHQNRHQNAPIEEDLYPRQATCREAPATKELHRYNNSLFNNLAG